MSAYYNDNNPKIAAWLRELIKTELIADGEVDERSITDVSASDIVGFVQCHFFAGIGGWSYALRLAGWRDDQPVWTGSCPCQPFSSAGAGGGENDPRHLWPAWVRLIRECRPSVIIGEQTESAIGHGWLDGVFGDLEAEGYACGAVVLGAHSVGAPHIRQRLWFVAESEGARGRPDIGAVRTGAYQGLRDQEGKDERRAVVETGRLVNCGAAERMADTDSTKSSDGGLQQSGPYDERPQDAAPGFWSDLVWLPCRDGKARPTQSGLQPLAHGVPARVGRLRGYGNAIVPQVAAHVIRAYMDI